MTANNPSGPAINLSAVGPAKVEANLRGLGYGG